MKVTYTKYVQREESEFSHKYACWANNHMGWAKMKKANRRLAKRRMAREYARMTEDV